MTSLKITRFLGTAPKNSPELLPDTAAQVSRNTKLYSGDLIPYPTPAVVANTGKTGRLRTLYALRDPDTDELKWLSWENAVSIATPATDENAEQRFYYTGDGVPKVSTYALATGGAGPYPTTYYDLGLPLPTLTPTTAAAEFTPVYATSYKRDSGGNVTLTTSAPHNLKSSAQVTISGFSYKTGTYSQSGTTTLTVTITAHGLETGAEVYLEFTSGSAASNRYTIRVTGPNTFTLSTASATTSGSCRWDIRDLNITTEVTAEDDTTISYYSPGPAIALTSLELSATYARSAGSGVTTITTATAHKLSDDDTVYVTFTSGDITESDEYIVTNTSTNSFEITTTDTTAATGDATVLLVAGKIDLGDQLQARSYLYTWYTPWGEESIGSEPAEALFIKEGQVVTVSGLPTAPPAGNNFIRGIRLYRTLSGTTDADYFRLATLWFPNTITTVQRTAGVSRVTVATPHNFLVDDRFKISGCSATAFDITDGVVTEIIDQYTFEYAQAGANIIAVSATGTLYYDISENPTKDDARYWGDGGYDFTDDFSYRSLLNTLRSTDYDQPPDELQGLVVFRNNIFAGFVGNDVYFSEPGIYHAWPLKYKRSFETNIVGLAPIAGDLLVLTEGYPYLLSGNDPAILSQAKLSARYPCLNQQSIVETSFGTVWSTHDGLAVFSPSIAGQLLSRRLHSSDTWNAALDPTTLVGVMYKDTYIASHATASIVFENDEKTGPSFVDNDFAFTAAWYDAQTNNLYVIAGEDGDVYQWDDLSQPSSIMTWKSKVFITKEYTNIGAARVVADYSGELPSPVWELADDHWEETDILWNAADPLTFKLYVDKNLFFTTTLSDSNVFRLPSGYRSDTFEIELVGTARVRAVHLGETPTSLRKT